MPAPAPKIAALIEELRDVTRALSEFRLYGIEREARALWRKGVISEAALQHVLGCVYVRLERPTEAVSYATTAARLDPQPLTLNNAGVALMNVGRAEEAVEFLLRAAEQPDGRTALVLGNLAEALAAACNYPAAREVLEEALDRLEPDDVMGLYRLSDNAAGVGQHELAVELFARFLVRANGLDRAGRDALAVIDEAPASCWDGLRVPESIAAAIGRAWALRQPRPEPAPDASPEATASAVAAHASFADARARATSAVLGDDGR